jgi:hypothetical protein
LIRNSIGLAGTDFYTVTGSMLTSQADDLKQLGFASGFYNPLGVGGAIKQRFETIPGQFYTISFKMNKTNDSTIDGWAGVDLLNSAGAKVVFIGSSRGAGITDGYKTFEYSFQATEEFYFVNVTMGKDIEATVTGLMVNLGYLPLMWTMATGELYTANTKADINGFQVSQIANGKEVGRTLMSPTKFAGYYDVDENGNIDMATGSPDEVFRMDKDEFVMKKATVKSEITMGTLKAISVQSDTFSGWVFVSNKTS